jgi:hypothetical protein
MVSSDGAIGVLGVSAHIAQVYSLTWARACVQHNHANGSGVGFRVDSKHLQEAKACALIVCSSCNISQLPPMY